MDRRHSKTFKDLRSFMGRRSSIDERSSKGFIRAEDLPKLSFRQKIFEWFSIDKRPSKDFFKQTYRNFVAEIKGLPWPESLQRFFIDRILGPLFNERLSKSILLIEEESSVNRRLFRSSLQKEELPYSIYIKYISGVIYRQRTFHRLFFYMQKFFWGSLRIFYR